MNGTFYGVSVGPGDPELLTLKAVRIIKSCPVVAAPRTKGENMLALSIAEKAVDMAGKTIVPLDFPMKYDRIAQHENHYRIAEQLAVYLANGQDVAMLNIGDVSLYSSCTYIAAELAKMGYETKMCAGVPSFCAAAAELNIQLTEGRQPLTIIPAQYENAREMIDWEGTKVIMKSGRKLSEIKVMLPDSCTVFAVENCGLPDQKLYRNIGEITDCGYLTVVIVK
ncbi:MAG: precorrin-2 C(20)-methyltransferase [Ruminiclostridium sp.]|nr:precorrin-2 C(20)-methyltransferase [Ruminiclostridium sp.]MBP3855288.1 precorrin-2 C(20)-methyltransferase [Ruminiclostridium sp.]